MTEGSGASVSDETIAMRPQHCLNRLPLPQGHGALRDEGAKTLAVNGKTYGPNDWISLDGGKAPYGEVYEGQVPTVDASLSGEFAQIMKWADEYRTSALRPTT